MFVDKVRIYVAGGDGGGGASSFRREAHVPRGGPDGGDGGHGGDVVLVAERGLTTLNDYRTARHFRARPGGRGAGRRAHGRKGAAIELRVPPGTVIRTHPEGEWLGELLIPGERIVVARGGRGGLGNVHFATATHQAPRHATKGEPGERRWVEMELKLIADAALVGAPNAGKSTLLAALTAATPRVGSYPFTTLEPNLGVLELDDERRVTVADVPGLIEGAHRGAGLGHEFLRHVERTRVLIAVVDGAAARPLPEWDAVADELRRHDPSLLVRPGVTVVTKLDVPHVAAAWPALRDDLEAAGHRPIAVSAHAGLGLDAVRSAIGDALLEADRRAPERPLERPVRVHRFDPLEEGFEVVAEAGALRVRGHRLERAAARTDFENEESRGRFQALLERLGVDDALQRAGARPGTSVRIGDTELEWADE